MKLVWKGKHPNGGTISSVELTDQELKDLVLPDGWQDDLINLFDYKVLAKRLGIRTKWLAINAS